MSEDSKSSSTYDVLQLMEDYLRRISVGPGIKKVIISGPDWLCRMIEKERNGKDNNTNK